MWALDNGCTFANAGSKRSHDDIRQAPSARKNEPITRVNWYNSIVWCNALSEYLGFHPVYIHHGAVIINAMKIDHTVVVAIDRNGFRTSISTGTIMSHWQKLLSNLLFFHQNPFLFTLNLLICRRQLSRV